MKNHVDHRTIKGFSHLSLIVLAAIAFLPLLVLRTLLVHLKMDASTLFHQQHPSLGGRLAEMSLVRMITGISRGAGLGKICKLTNCFYRRRGKRILDLLLTTSGLIVCFPIMALIAILIYFKLGSPILFRQQRPGLKGKSFELYKFRTMTNQRDAHGNLLPDDKRITPFGQFLRRASLDELPELFNVLQGNMSLVGPRPLLVQYLDHYSQEQMRRHDVLPGITGWAQVHGRNATPWKERFAMDVWYVDNLSLWLDLQILGLTVLKVLRQEDIDKEGYVGGGEYFRGTN